MKRKREDFMRIQSTRVWIGERFAPAQLEISGGQIWSVDPYDQKNSHKDYGNCMILPGFIDIHCHARGRCHLVHADGHDG